MKILPHGDYCSRQCFKTETVGTGFHAVNKQDSQDACITVLCKYNNMHILVHGYSIPTVSFVY